jgi:hypothetical protein
MDSKKKLALVICLIAAVALAAIVLRFSAEHPPAGSLTEESTTEAVTSSNDGQVTLASSMASDSQLKEIAASELATKESSTSVEFVSGMRDNLTSHQNASGGESCFYLSYRSHVMYSSDKPTWAMLPDAEVVKWADAVANGTAGTPTTYTLTSYDNTTSVLTAVPLVSEDGQVLGVVGVSKGVS